ncbi:MAG: NAD(P)-dependent oxidoreductase [Deltaproteobacteria bacterium]|jgi:3-hydroxyisobutyrate dehydrogenase-like beta-hydroxyacid dehydrogenase|nr:MAG: NAD(P)-dependent oxidoreductase [Deltaproteobacteria bacterium]
MAQVAFIGLGKMGRPMATRLLQAGHQVQAFNRSRGPVDELAKLGASPATSATEAATRAEVILTALPTAESVARVYEELARAARAGQLYADHSTVSLELNRRCATQLRERGAHFLDAPVSGGPAGAQAGTLTVMVGGDKAAFDIALPVFQAFGKNIRLCGGVGAGQAIKLVNQLLVGVHTAAIAEAAVLGAKLGADPRTVLDLIGTSFGGSTMMTRNLPRFISRDFGAATSVRLLLKDLGIIHDEAKGAQVPLLLGAVAEQRFLEAAARGLADQDMAALVRLWEEAAGVTVDRPASS